MGEYVAVVRHAWPSVSLRGVGEMLLDSVSKEQAILRGLELQDLGYDLGRVAISNGSARTIQTAQAMQEAVVYEDGRRIAYPQLNEITSYPRLEVMRSFRQGILPPGFYEKGEELLETMPVEDVWVTHNSIMGAMLTVMRERMGIQPENPSLVMPFLGYLVIHRELRVPPVLHREQPQWQDADKLAG